MNWQPIGSAPMDGRRILLLYQSPYASCVVGEWNTDRFAKKPAPYWSSDREHITGTRHARAVGPTHWMPLPELPSAASPELLAALATDESNHINPLAHEQTR